MLLHNLLADIKYMDRPAHAVPSSFLMHGEPATPLLDGMPGQPSEELKEQRAKAKSQNVLTSQKQIIYSLTLLNVHP